MKNLIRTVVVTLSLLTVSAASANQIQGPTVTAEFARDALPPCGRASMVIFNGASFDGNVYLHDTDIALSAQQVKQVRAIALDGQLPALCQVQGLPFVTVASR